MAGSPLLIDEALQRFTGEKREIVARHLETLAILGELQRLASRYHAPLLTV
jgi:hypothetical protein